MKKYIIAVLAAAMLLSQAAYASEIKTVRNIGNAEFCISGSAAKDSAITIDVYAPGTDVSDLLSAQKPIDVVKYHNEVYAGEDGTYKIELALDGESGVYPTYVTVDGKKNLINLEFINNSESSSAIAGLNSAADKLQYIEDNKENLGFFIKLYENVNKEEVVKMLSAKMPLDASDAENAVRLFNEAVIARAITENKLTGISDVKKDLGLLNNGEKYETWYNSASASGVDARLNGKTFSSIDEFENALAEAIVLEVVKAPNGYENVRKIINDFKSEIGIASPVSTAAVYQSLAEKNYNSFAALKTAYESAISNNEPPKGGNSSPGSGNTTKGSSGVGIPSQPTTDLTPIEKEYFEDMKGAEWAKPAVNYLAEKKIVSGKSEKEFCPSDYVNREEFVTMIIKAFDFKIYADVSQFTDVNKEDWYYNYVLTAYQNEIVSGISDDRFGAGEKITRQDMAAILFRVLNVKQIKLPEINAAAGFSDETEIADYAKEAVNVLQVRGIINGIDNRFEPKSLATRAQAAQMIYQIIKE